jgi:hypothetical protein
MDREPRRIVFTGPEQAEVETVPFDPSWNRIWRCSARGGTRGQRTELSCTDQHDIGHGGGKRFWPILATRRWG